MAKFEKGQSGNPEGGRLHRSGRLRALLHDAAPEVVGKLIADAKKGEPVALRLFLDRVLPVLKGETDRVSFELPEGTSPTAQARLLMSLAADGTLAPDVVEQMINALAKLVQVEQADELRAQLALLMADRYRGLA